MAPRHILDVAADLGLDAQLVEPHGPYRAKVSLDNRKNHERELPKQLLGLEDDDYNRLMDTMAASDLRYAEALYRCNTDPTCDINSVIGTEMKANKREMVELLGAEKAQWLENYRDNHMERNSVATFSSQMPESLRLSDEQAEKLAEALGDELVAGHEA